MVHWMPIIILGAAFLAQFILYGLLLSHPDFPAYMAAGLKSNLETENFKHCKK